MGTVQAEKAASGALSLPHAPPGGAQAYTLTLPEEGLPSGMPQEFEVRFNSPPPATYVFSEKDGSLGAPDPLHHGRVIARGEIKPKELTKEYRERIRERKETSEVRAAVGVIEDDHGLHHTKLDHQEAVKAVGVKKEVKQQRRELNAKKRARPELSKGELKDQIKRLFATQRYWSRRDLKDELGNENKLASCLEEVCDKVTSRRSVHFGDYELKPNFRIGGETSTS